MKELFNVDFHGDDSFTMNMKNGKIDVPAEQDCYAISTGCGSGKTECCKSIIRQKHNEGVLYCVDTIAELDKMYRWIIENKDDIGIKPSEVIIISSYQRHQDFTREYRDNPEILMSKHVVLISHHRFWTDLINYFLIYKPKIRDYDFNGDFMSLMAREDLRRYVIFDETPLFITPFFKMSKELLGIFTDYNSGAWQCKNLDEIEKYYHKFIADKDLNPFQNQDYKINRIKREVVFGLLPKYFPRWIDNDEVAINFTPLCLCQPVIKSHILIMEGAGNVLFQESKHYKLLDVPYKYNSRVKFEEFEFGLTRRKTLDEKAYAEFLGWLTKRLSSNHQKGKKTLVVVWMNQGKDVSENDHKYYDDIVKDLGQKRIPGDSYRVIYYGSSESKSTNEFREYSEVILCGKWGIVNSETAKFNQNFGVNIANPHHKLWAYIQLLCRIGIRMHDGGEFTVLYSSDYSKQWISQLQEYFENKPLNIPACLDSDSCPEWLDKKITDVGIGVMRKREIVLLCEWLGDKILLPLQQDLEAKIDISLDDLYQVIKRSRKKKDTYKRLISDLSKLGITLIISRKQKGHQK